MDFPFADPSRCNFPVLDGFMYQPSPDDPTHPDIKGLSEHEVEQLRRADELFGHEYDPHATMFDGLDTTVSALLGAADYSLCPPSAIKPPRHAQNATFTPFTPIKTGAFPYTPLKSHSRADVRPQHFPQPSSGMFTHSSPSPYLHAPKSDSYGNFAHLGISPIPNRYASAVTSSPTHTPSLPTAALPPLPYTASSTPYIASTLRTDAGLPPRMPQTPPRASPLHTPSPVPHVHAHPQTHTPTSASSAAAPVAVSANIPYIPHLALPTCPSSPSCTPPPSTSTATATSGSGSAHTHKVGRSTHVPPAAAATHLPLAAAPAHLLLDTPPATPKRHRTQHTLALSRTHTPTHAADTNAAGTGTSAAVTSVTSSHPSPLLGMKPLPSPRGPASPLYLKPDGKTFFPSLPSEYSQLDFYAGDAPPQSTPRAKVDKYRDQSFFLTTPRRGGDKREDGPGSTPRAAKGSHKSPQVDQTSVNSQGGGGGGGGHGNASVGIHDHNDGVSPLRDGKHGDSAIPGTTTQTQPRHHHLRDKGDRCHATHGAAARPPQSPYLAPPRAHALTHLQAPTQTRMQTAEQMQVETQLHTQTSPAAVTTPPAAHTPTHAHVHAHVPTHTLVPAPPRVPTPGIGSGNLAFPNGTSEAAPLAISPISATGAMPHVSGMGTGIGMATPIRPRYPHASPAFKAQMLLSSRKNVVWENYQDRVPEVVKFPNQNVFPSPEDENWQKEALAGQLQACMDAVHRIDWEKEQVKYPGKIHIPENITKSSLPENVKIPHFPEPSEKWISHDGVDGNVYTAAGVRQVAHTVVVPCPCHAIGCPLRLTSTSISTLPPSTPLFASSTVQSQQPPQQQCACACVCSCVEVMSAVAAAMDACDESICTHTPTNPLCRRVCPLPSTIFTFAQYKLYFVSTVGLVWVHPIVIYDAATDTFPLEQLLHSDLSPPQHTAQRPGVTDAATQRQAIRDAIDSVFKPLHSVQVDVTAHSLSSMVPGNNMSAAYISESPTYTQQRMFFPKPRLSAFISSGIKEENPEDLSSDSDFSENAPTIPSSNPEIFFSGDVMPDSTHPLTLAATTTSATSAPNTTATTTAGGPVLSALPSSASASSASASSALGPSLATPSLSTPLLSAPTVQSLPAPTAATTSATAHSATATSGATALTATTGPTATTTTTTTTTAAAAIAASNPAVVGGVDAPATTTAAGGCTVEVTAAASSGLAALPSQGMGAQVAVDAQVGHVVEKRATVYVDEVAEAEVGKGDGVTASLHSDRALHGGRTLPSVAVRGDGSLPSDRVLHSQRSSLSLGRDSRGTGASAGTSMGMGPSTGVSVDDRGVGITLMVTQPTTQHGMGVGISTGLSSPNSGMGSPLAGMGMSYRGYSPSLSSRNVTATSNISRAVSFGQNNSENPPLSSFPIFPPKPGMATPLSETTSMPEGSLRDGNRGSARGLATRSSASMGTTTSTGMASGTGLSAGMFSEIPMPEDDDTVISSPSAQILKKMSSSVTTSSSLGAKSGIIHFSGPREPDSFRHSSIAANALSSPSLPLASPHTTTLHSGISLPRDFDDVEFDAAYQPGLLGSGDWDVDSDMEDDLRTLHSDRTSATQRHSRAADVLASGKSTDDVYARAGVHGSVHGDGSAVGPRERTRAEPPTAWDAPEQLQTHQGKQPQSRDEERQQQHQKQQQPGRSRGLGHDDQALSAQPTNAANVRRKAPFAFSVAESARSGHAAVSRTAAELAEMHDDEDKNGQFGKMRGNTFSGREIFSRALPLGASLPIVHASENDDFPEFGDESEIAPLPLPYTSAVPSSHGVGTREMSQHKTATSSGGNLLSRDDHLFPHDDHLSLDDSLVNLIGVTTPVLGAKKSTNLAAFSPITAPDKKLRNPEKNTEKERISLSSERSSDNPEKDALCPTVLPTTTASITATAATTSSTTATSSTSTTTSTSIASSNATARHNSGNDGGDAHDSDDSHMARATVTHTENNTSIRNNTSDTNSQSIVARASSSMRSLDITQMRAEVDESTRTRNNSLMLDSRPGIRNDNVLLGEELPLLSPLLTTHLTNSTASNINNLVGIPMIPLGSTFATTLGSSVLGNILRHEAVVAETQALVKADNDLVASNFNHLAGASNKISISQLELIDSTAPPSARHVQAQTNMSAHTHMSASRHTSFTAQPSLPALNSHTPQTPLTSAGLAATLPTLAPSLQSSLPLTLASAPLHSAKSLAATLPTGGPLASMLHATAPDTSSAATHTAAASGGLIDDRIDVGDSADGDNFDDTEDSFDDVDNNDDDIHNADNSGGDHHDDNDDVCNDDVSCYLEQSLDSFETALTHSNTHDSHIDAKDTVHRHTTTTGSDSRAAGGGARVPVVADRIQPPDNNTRTSNPLARTHARTRTSTSANTGLLASAPATYLTASTPASLGLFSSDFQKSDFGKSAAGNSDFIGSGSMFGFSGSMFAESMLDGEDIELPQYGDSASGSGCGSADRVADNRNSHGNCDDRSLGVVHDAVYEDDDADYDTASDDGLDGHGGHSDVDEYGGGEGDGGGGGTGEENDGGGYTEDYFDGSDSSASGGDAHRGGDDAAGCVSDGEGVESAEVESQEGKDYAEQMYATQPAVKATTAAAAATVTSAAGVGGSGYGSDVDKGTGNGNDGLPSASASAFVSAHAAHMASSPTSSSSSSSSSAHPTTSSLLRLRRSHQRLPHSTATQHTPSDITPQSLRSDINSHTLYSSSADIDPYACSGDIGARTVLSDIDAPTDSVPSDGGDVRANSTPTTATTDDTATTTTTAIGSTATAAAGSTGTNPTGASVPACAQTPPSPHSLAQSLAQKHTHSLAQPRPHPLSSSLAPSLTQSLFTDFTQLLSSEALQDIAQRSLGSIDGLTAVDTIVSSDDIVPSSVPTPAGDGVKAAVGTVTVVNGPPAHSIVASDVSSPSEAMSLTQRIHQLLYTPTPSPRVQPAGAQSLAEAAHTPVSTYGEPADGSGVMEHVAVACDIGCDVNDGDDGSGGIAGEEETYERGLYTLTADSLDGDSHGGDGDHGGQDDVDNDCATDDVDDCDGDADGDGEEWESVSAQEASAEFTLIVDQSGYRHLHEEAAEVWTRTQEKERSKGKMAGRMPVQHSLDDDDDSDQDGFLSHTIHRDNGPNISRNVTLNNTMIGSSLDSASITQRGNAPPKSIPHADGVLGHDGVLISDVIVSGDINYSDDGFVMQECRTARAPVSAAYAEPARLSIPVPSAQTTRVSVPLSTTSAGSQRASADAIIDFGAGAGMGGLPRAPMQMSLDDLSDDSMDDYDDNTFQPTGNTDNFDDTYIVNGSGAEERAYVDRDHDYAGGLHRHHDDDDDDVGRRFLEEVETEADATEGVDRYHAYNTHIRARAYPGAHADARDGLGVSDDGVFGDIGDGHGVSDLGDLHLQITHNYSGDAFGDGGGDGALVREERVVKDLLHVSANNHDHGDNLYNTTYVDHFYDRVAGEEDLVDNDDLIFTYDGYDEEADAQAQAEIETAAEAREYDTNDRYGEYDNGEGGVDGVEYDAEHGTQHGVQDASLFDAEYESYVSYYEDMPPAAVGSDYGNSVGAGGASNGDDDDGDGNDDTGQDYADADDDGEVDASSYGGSDGVSVTSDVLLPSTPPRPSPSSVSAALVPPLPPHSLARSPRRPARSPRRSSRSQLTASRALPHSPSLPSRPLPGSASPHNATNTHTDADADADASARLSTHTSDASSAHLSDNTHSTRPAITSHAPPRRSSLSRKYTLDTSPASTDTDTETDTCVDTQTETEALENTPILPIVATGTAVPTYTDADSASEQQQAQLDVVGRQDDAAASAEFDFSFDNEAYVGPGSNQKNDMDPKVEENPTFPTRGLHFHPTSTTIPIPTLHSEFTVQEQNITKNSLPGGSSHVDRNNKPVDNFYRVDDNLNDDNDNYTSDFSDTSACFSSASAASSSGDLGINTGTLAATGAANARGGGMRDRERKRRSMLQSSVCDRSYLQALFNTSRNAHNAVDNANSTHMNNNTSNSNTTAAHVPASADAAANADAASMRISIPGVSAAATSGVGNNEGVNGGEDMDRSVAEDGAGQAAEEVDGCDHGDALDEMTMALGYFDFDLGLDGLDGEGLGADGIDCESVAGEPRATNGPVTAGIDAARMDTEDLDTHAMGTHHVDAEGSDGQAKARGAIATATGATSEVALVDSEAALPNSALTSDDLLDSVLPLHSVRSVSSDDSGEIPSIGAILLSPVKTRLMVNTSNTTATTAAATVEAIPNAVASSVIAAAEHVEDPVIITDDKETVADRGDNIDDNRDNYDDDDEDDDVMPSSDLSDSDDDRVHTPQRTIPHPMPHGASLNNPDVHTHASTHTDAHTDVQSPVLEDITALVSAPPSASVPPVAGAAATAATAPMSAVPAWAARRAAALGLPSGPGRGTPLSDADVDALAREMAMDVSGVGVEGNGIGADIDDGIADAVNDGVGVGGVVAVRGLTTTPLPHTAMHAATLLSATISATATVLGPTSSTTSSTIDAPHAPDAGVARDSPPPARGPTSTLVGSDSVPICAASAVSPTTATPAVSALASAAVTSSEAPLTAPLSEYSYSDDSSDHSLDLDPMKPLTHTLAHPSTHPLTPSVAQVLRTPGAHTPIASSTTTATSTATAAAVPFVQDTATRAGALAAPFLSDISAIALQSIYDDTLLHGDPLHGDQTLQGPTLLHGEALFREERGHLPDLLENDLSGKSELADDDDLPILESIPHATPPMAIVGADTTAMVKHDVDNVYEDTLPLSTLPSPFTDTHSAHTQTHAQSANHHHRHNGDDASTSEVSYDGKRNGAVDDSGVDAGAHRHAWVIAVEGASGSASVWGVGQLSCHTTHTSSTHSLASTHSLHTNITASASSSAPRCATASNDTTASDNISTLLYAGHATADTVDAVPQRGPPRTPQQQEMDKCTGEVEEEDGITASAYPSLLHAHNAPCADGTPDPQHAHSVEVPILPGYNGQHTSPEHPNAHAHTRTRTHAPIGANAPTHPSGSPAASAKAADAPSPSPPSAPAPASLLSASPNISTSTSPFAALDTSLNDTQCRIDRALTAMGHNTSAADLLADRAANISFADRTAHTSLANRAADAFFTDRTADLPANHVKSTSFAVHADNTKLNKGSVTNTTFNGGSAVAASPVGGSAAESFAERDTARGGVGSTLTNFSSSPSTSTSTSTSTFVSAPAVLLPSTSLSHLLAPLFPGPIAVAGDVSLHLHPHTLARLVHDATGLEVQPLNGPAGPAYEEAVTGLGDAVENHAVAAGVDPRAGAVLAIGDPRDAAPASASTSAFVSRMAARVPVPERERVSVPSSLTISMLDSTAHLTHTAPTEQTTHNASDAPHPSSTKHPNEAAVGPDTSPIEQTTRKHEPHPHGDAKGSFTALANTNHTSNNNGDHTIAGANINMNPNATTNTSTAPLARSPSRALQVRHLRDRQRMQRLLDVSSRLAQSYTQVDAPSYAHIDADSTIQVDRHAHTRADSLAHAHASMDATQGSTQADATMSAGAASGNAPTYARVDNHLGQRVATLAPAVPAATAVATAITTAGRGPVTTSAADPTAVMTVETVAGAAPALPSTPTPTPTPAPAPVSPSLSGLVSTVVPTHVPTSTSPSPLDSTIHPLALLRETDDTMFPDTDTAAHAATASATHFSLSTPENDSLLRLADVSAWYPSAVTPAHSHTNANADSSLYNTDPTGDNAPAAGPHTQAVATASAPPALTPTGTLTSTQRLPAQYLATQRIAATQRVPGAPYAPTHASAPLPLPHGAWVSAPVPAMAAARAEPGARTRGREVVPLDDVHADAHVDLRGQRLFSDGMIGNPFVSEDVLPRTLPSPSSDAWAARVWDVEREQKSAEYGYTEHGLPDGNYRGQEYVNGMDSRRQYFPDENRIRNSDPRNNVEENPDNEGIAGVFSPMYPNRHYSRYPHHDIPSAHPHTPSTHTVTHAATHTYPYPYQHRRPAASPAAHTITPTYASYPHATHTSHTPYTHRSPQPGDRYAPPVASHDALHPAESHGLGPDERRRYALRADDRNTAAFEYGYGYRGGSAWERGDRGERPQRGESNARDVSIGHGGGVRAASRRVDNITDAEVDLSRFLPPPLPTVPVNANANRTDAIDPVNLVNSASIISSARSGVPRVSSMPQSPRSSHGTASHGTASRIPTSNVPVAAYHAPADAAYGVVDAVDDGLVAGEWERHAAIRHLQIHAPRAPLLSAAALTSPIRTSRQQQLPIGNVSSHPHSTARSSLPHPPLSSSSSSSLLAQPFHLAATPATTRMRRVLGPATLTVATEPHSNPSMAMQLSNKHTPLPASISMAPPSEEHLHPFMTPAPKLLRPHRTSH